VIRLASAPTLWNSLPHSVLFSESLTTFRKHLKTFYFQAAFAEAPWRPTTQDSIPDFWHFTNSFTYLLTYLYKPKQQSLVHYKSYVRNYDTDTVENTVILYRTITGLPAARSEISGPIF